MAGSNTLYGFSPPWSETDEELQFHLEHATGVMMVAGMTPV
jgi:hypothetical protein